MSPVFIGIFGTVNRFWCQQNAVSTGTSVLTINVSRTCISISLPQSLLLSISWLFIGYLGSVCTFWMLVSIYCGTRWISESCDVIKTIIFQVMLFQNFKENSTVNLRINNLIHFPLPLKLSKNLTTQIWMYMLLK